MENTRIKQKKYLFRASWKEGLQKRLFLQVCLQWEHDINLVKKALEEDQGVSEHKELRDILKESEKALIQENVSLLKEKQHALSEAAESPLEKRLSQGVQKVLREI